MTAPKPTDVTPMLGVEVSADKRQAWLLTPPVTLDAERPITEADVRAALEKKKIAIDASVEQRIAGYLGLIESQADAEQPEIPAKYLIAEGTAPTEPIDAEFIWDERFEQHKPHDPDEPIDYYSLNSIVTVEAETIIGRIVPETAGVAGCNVFGQEIPPQRRRGARIELGNGLELGAEQPDQVITHAAGRVVEEIGRLRVDEVLQIPGDIDFDTGNVEAKVEVDVRGAIRSNFKVHGKKSLSVGGTIEAADVDLARDVTCMKGVVGNNRQGRVCAGGTITVRFANEAHLTAAGDIQIARSAMNSLIRTDGFLRIENGAIVGGEAYARAGVQAKILGSEAGVVTEIAVGVDPVVLVKLRDLDREIQQHTKMADQIRQRVEPLLASLKRLSREQREKATELLEKADTFELKISDLQTEKQRLLERSVPAEPPRVEVTKWINPGVRISFGLRVWEVSSALKGHHAIEQREISDVTEVVACNKLTGSISVLKTRELDIEQFRPMAEKLGEPDGNTTDPDDQA